MRITGFIPGIRARCVGMNYGIKSFTLLLINPQSLSPTEKIKGHIQFFVGVTKGFKINMIFYIGDSESKFSSEKMFLNQGMTLAFSHGTPSLNTFPFS